MKEWIFKQNTFRRRGRIASIFFFFYWIIRRVWGRTCDITVSYTEIYFFYFPLLFCIILRHRTAPTMYMPHNHTSHTLDGTVFEIIIYCLDGMERRNHYFGELRVITDNRCQRVVRGERLFTHDAYFHVPQETKKKQYAYRTIITTFYKS